MNQKNIYVLNVRDSSVLEYELRISTASRRLRVTVFMDGRCVVTAPRATHPSVVERFVQEKSLWILRKKEMFKGRPERLVLRGDAETYRKYRHQALVIVIKKIAHYNALYQFPFSRVSIRNQKSRWGSCSRRGNLNFNVKIALIPEVLAEYIVVHELCHLEQLNHSRKFWDLVSRTIPDHAMRRRALAQYQFES